MQVTSHKDLRSIPRCSVSRRFQEFRQGMAAQGPPGRSAVYDFIDKAPDKGRVTPYGVYDLTANEGWVSVGTDHDTARFAAQTILKWWREMGQSRYPNAKELLITADGGGSNSSRCRLWKIAIQELADETGLTLNVSHFPPGTSKWNKIEYILFCHVTQNWRGRPAGQPRSDRKTDRRHKNQGRTQGQGGVGYDEI